MRKSFATLSLVAAAALLLASSAFAADPKPGDAVNGLLLTLGPAQAKGTLSDDVVLVSTFRNVGAQALSLPNWRDGRLAITDAQDKVVAPGKGPVRPTGALEGDAILTPGNESQENQGLVKTQPAGDPRAIGYQYDLLPGVYKVALIYEVKAPPKAGAWAGQISSNEIALIIVGPPASVMTAIKAEWPQAEVTSIRRLPGRPQQGLTGLWSLALENKIGEKAQAFSASVTETGVVTRVRTPLQPAEVPQAVTTAVMDFYSSGPRTSVPNIEIRKANKVETRVNLQRAKLPQPVMSYEVYVAGIQPAVWLYVSADMKVSRTDDAPGSSTPTPAPNPNEPRRVPITTGPPKTAG